VTQTIPKSASADEIRSSVKLVDVPVRLRAQDAIADLSDVDDDVVAAVDLNAGEQLLASRLVDARSLTKVDTPTGLQQLTVALDPERAVGGELTAGDTVGIVISFDPFNLDESAPLPLAQPADGQTTTTVADTRKTPNMTHLTFHKVLVTGVQFDQSEYQDPTGSSDPEPVSSAVVDRAPRNKLLVTLALSSPQVEQVVFAAEFGHLWLTAEGAAADETGTRVVTLGEAYGTEVPK
jgi:pilus assembly protein CpaB